MTDSKRKELFMVLYEPTHDAFQRFCRARSNSADDAKDLSSETVLRAYQDLHRLRDEKAFLAFLFGIASNILKKEYRRKKFTALFEFSKAERIPDPSSNPELKTDTELLYDAIQQLPAKYQEAVVLHSISGFSLEEVAIIQHSSLSAVKIRVMRAKERLANLLKVPVRSVVSAKKVSIISTLLL
jgi:RNA polymerase sigma-70 factor (ECF subfamily)